MLRQCRWFDRYRDGELPPEKQMYFRSHLASCDQCRRKLALLDGLVHTLQQEECVQPVILAERIALRAMENTESWDVIFLSWLKPALAWPAVALLLAVLAGVWLAPMVWRSDTYSDYEILLAQSDPSGMAQSISDTMTDRELEGWLNP